MSFAEYHGERTQERARQSEQPSIFPERDIPLAVFRLQPGDEKVKKLAGEIKKKGVEAVLPSDVLATDQHGQLGIDLTVLENPGMAAAQHLFEIPGAVELVRVLNQDFLLSRRESLEVRRFRRERTRVARTVGAELVASLKQEIDYRDELVGEATEHPFSSEEEKTAFETLEKFSQGVVDRLFAASGLKNVRPKVQLTRSGDVNAWVWAVGREDAAAEYLTLAHQAAAPLDLPIFIHQGLLRKVESPDELAGILAHEFSHLLQPTYLGQTDNAKRRRLEYDADASGGRLADAGGFNPRGLITFLKRIDGSTAQKFGWGTHPDRDHRIIELEKEFNRTDLPLPNAAKPYASMPVEVTKALGTIEATSKPSLVRVEDGPDSTRRRRELTSKEYLGEHHEPEYLINLEMQRACNNEAKLRVKEVFVEQELAHDTTGQRTAMLMSLETTLLALSLRSQLGPKDSISVKVPTYGGEPVTQHLPDGTVKRVAEPSALPETVLSIPKEESYLHAGQTIGQVKNINDQHIIRERSIHTNLLEEVAPEVRAAFAAGWRARTIDDWIDPNNSTVQPFWDEVIKAECSQSILKSNAGQIEYYKFAATDLTREERLYYIYRLLSSFSSARADQGNLIAVSRTKFIAAEIELWDKAESQPAEEKKGVLARIRLAGRAARREEPSVTTPSAPRKMGLKPVMTDLATLRGNDAGDKWLNSLWDRSPEEQAPIIQEYAAIVQDQTVAAFEEFLKKEGLTDCDPAIVRYCAARLFDNRYDSGYSGTRRTGELLPMLPEVSITALDQAVTILETKQLGKAFAAPLGSHVLIEMSNRQAALIQQLYTAVAFALRPRTPDEEKIQERYRRQIELYKTAADHVELGEVADADTALDAHHTRKLSQQDPHSSIYVSVANPTLVATSERIWSSTKDVVNHLRHGGEMKALAVPDAFNVVVSRPDDTKVVRDAVWPYVQKVESPVWQTIREEIGHFPAVVRAYCDYIYEEGILTKENLADHYTQEKFFLSFGSNHWTIIQPLVEETVQELWLAHSQELLQASKGEITKVDFTTMVENVARRSLSGADRMKHDRLVTLDSTDRMKFGSDVDWNNSTEGLLYAPASTPERFGERQGIDKERAIEYLTILSETNPAAATLAATLKAWPKRSHFPGELAVVCMGHLTKFESKYYPYATTDQVITVWRQAAAVYHEEWQHIEQYKSLDEQLSTWEWTKWKSDLFPRSVEVKEKNEVREPRPARGEEAYSLAWYIEGKMGGDLAERYATASKDHTTLKFSWPLFMTDLWDGKTIFPAPDRAKKYQPVLEAFLSELHRLVGDPRNLDMIKKMQPGFFREFLLAKKLESLAIDDLDDLEPWLEYFTSHPHEASARNQIPGLIEQARSGHREKRKMELAQSAITAIVSNPRALEFFTVVGALRDQSLTDKDMTITFNANLLSQVRGQTVAERQNVHNTAEVLADKEAYLAYLDDLSARHTQIIEAMYHTYDELTEAARQESMAATTISEDQAYIFSDHIIEHDKSRLEVGPVYRYRLASQKLMDWHVAELRRPHTPDETTALFTRVEKILPEAHPLKDIFIKNQTAVEIWQTLQGALSPEQMASMGISLTETNVDLTKVMPQFPLYAEVAFLKNYSVFALSGLEGAIDRIPRDTAETILLRLEKVVRAQISPDQKNAFRRMLMQLERRVRWPELRTARQTDGAVFEGYLQRITDLYPEASHERDDLLESVGMDLAYTPTQIRAVTHLTYAEQVRWPNEHEHKAVAAQHSGFEKMRGYLSTLNEVERAQYILWFAGGSMPLSESLSSEKTHISLTNRAETFWSLSPVERRNLLYDFCMGEKGVMVGQAGFYQPVQSKPWPEWKRDSDMIKYIADKLFETAFGEGAIDADKPADDQSNVRGREMIQTIFSELLVHQPEAGRRAELLTNILEAIGSVRQEGRNLRPGELIRVLLEQIGVVGIKVGQVLSEQVGLLPESIRQDLLQLKDKTAQFSKRGILTYLESAGWVRGDESKVAMIGDVLGSASIKQVQDGRLDDDREVAIKAKRPSIDKNYHADMKVVERVFHTLEKKGFAVPSYLLSEVERLITEELSFVHEAENQVAMGASLQARSAKLELTFGGVREAVPLAVSAPLAVSEVLYPGPEQTADIGLIVEEKIKGLSLKEIQAYQGALTAGDDKVTKEFRDKIAHLYDPGRVREIEGKIKTLDTEKLQASLALEFLRQVVKGGVFHADLHSGNFYLDFTPQIAGGELYNQRAVLIDLGSAGYSRPEARPPHLQTESSEQFVGAEQFRDFLSALFSQTPKPGKIAEVVNRFTNLAWDAEKVQAISGGVSDTGEKVKKIFYAILDEGRGMIDNQFRYFLKAVATAADHLTKLRAAVQPEIDLVKTGRVTETVMLPQLINEGLLNIGLLL